VAAIVDALQARSATSRRAFHLARPVVLAKQGWVALSWRQIPSCRDRSFGKGCFVNGACVYLGQHVVGSRAPTKADGLRRSDAPTTEARRGTDRGRAMVEGDHDVRAEQLNGPPQPQPHKKLGSTRIGGSFCRKTLRFATWAACLDA
jgi:hypothetical protein